MTNLGVTRQVWSEWIGREASEKEMRGLTPEHVAPLYRRKYWDKVSGDFLPSGLDLAVFDFAVNSGPGRAAKVLQEILEVKVDGAIGPMTLTALADVDHKILIERYNRARQAFLEALPTYATFGRGWSRRVAETTDEAVSMLT
jgi:lysozyme family protein